MKKVNFKTLEIFTDITGKNKVIGDVRNDFSNTIYTSYSGIIAHSLAFRIYESDGEIDISDQEENLIIKVLHERCVPAFIDGVMSQLNKK